MEYSVKWVPRHGMIYINYILYISSIYIYVHRLMQSDCVQSYNAYDLLVTFRTIPVKDDVYISYLSETLQRVQ